VFLFKYTCPPLVNIPPVDGSADNTINISCFADSRPLSDISWSTGGKEITVCRRSAVCPVSVGNDSPGQLVNYTCTAENPFGKDAKYISLGDKG